MFVEKNYSDLRRIQEMLDMTSKNADELILF
jgi:hypothetical protein